MRHKLLLPTVVLALLVAAGLACDSPAADSAAILDSESLATFAAQTAAAVLTGTAEAAPDDATPGPEEESAATETPEPESADDRPTFTPTGEAPKPSDTPGPTNTPGATGCTDDSDFVSDVNYPDDSEVQPGLPFTKTWRLRNSGTCTWTTGYQFAYVSGSQMSAPASVNLSRAVAPGDTIDLSVTFVAPTAADTYRSQWQLRSAGGAMFGTQPYLRVVVPAATPTTAPSATTVPSPTPTPTATVGLPPAIALESVDYSPGSSGHVLGNGNMFAAPNVGDSAANTGRQAGVTFDLSLIPVGATVTQVELDFRTFDRLGDPFGNLGCLVVYERSFGSLGASDYTLGAAGREVMRHCSLGSLTTPSLMKLTDVSGVQAALGTTYQLWMRFETETDNDGVDDTLRPSPTLIITYEY